MNSEGDGVAITASDCNLFIFLCRKIDGAAADGAGKHRAGASRRLSGHKRRSAPGL
jgi:hypothetical protein